MFIYDAHINIINTSWTVTYPDCNQSEISGEGKGEFIHLLLWEIHAQIESYADWV